MDKNTWIELFYFTVTVGCGGSSSENCTYFEVTGATNGPCVASICKADSNICQVSWPIPDNQQNWETIFDPVSIFRFKV